MPCMSKVNCRRGRFAGRDAFFVTKVNCFEIFRIFFLSSPFIISGILIEISNVGLPILKKVPLFYTQQMLQIRLMFLHSDFEALHSVDI